MTAPINLNRVGLENEISGYLNGSKRDLAKAGVLLHAYGDSFAHTYWDRTQFRAYEVGIGHALSHGPLTGEWKTGHAVDQIRERYEDGQYTKYIRGLGSLLGADPNDPRINELIDYMKPLSDVRILKSGVYTRDGALYDDDEEIRRLKEFDFSSGGPNRRPDNYLFNELGSAGRAEGIFEDKYKPYFPEEGKMVGSPKMSGKDMVEVLNRLILVTREVENGKLPNVSPSWKSTK